MSEDVRLVLDTSAVLAYTTMSVGLGETIVEVVDEGARFAVPALCLVEAARLLRGDTTGDTGPAGLDLLVTHPHCVVLPMLAADWRPLAELTGLLGRADLAAGLLEAIDRDAYVITAEPGSYSPAGDENLPVIALW